MILRQAQDERMMCMNQLNPNPLGLSLSKATRDWSE